MQPSLFTSQFFTIVYAVVQDFAKVVVGFASIFSHVCGSTHDTHAALHGTQRGVCAEISMVKLSNIRLIWCLQAMGFTILTCICCTR